MHPSNAREHCPSICIDPIHERTDERTHARSTPPYEQIWRSSYAREGKQRMSDELDLDAGITFCGSWGADDCAFIREGQPLDWACGFH